MGSFSNLIAIVPKDGEVKNELQLNQKIINEGR